MKFSLINLGLTIAMTATCGSLAAEQHPVAIPLPDAVVIDHPGPVFLSDLLPHNSAMTIRNAAAEIELCQAPRAGTLRLLRADQILEATSAHADLLHQVIIPPRIAIRYLGRPADEGSIHRAISEFLRGHGWDRGLPEGAKLDLPEVSAAPGESFEVKDLHWDMQRQAMEVRLRCSKTQSCSGLLVYVFLPENLPEDSRAALVRAMSANSQPIPKRGLADAAHPPLVAKGNAATLIVEDRTMRISMPVICLEPGLLHQDIRVFDKRSRHVFLAQVIGDHLLRAGL